MLSVVLLGQFRGHLDQLHCDDVDSFFLKTGNNGAHETPLNAVGLE
jgi:hypothetical protein